MSPSPPGIVNCREDDVDDGGPPSSSSHSSSHPPPPIVRRLPRLLSVTAPRRPGQPAGLTLVKSRTPGGGGVVISSISGKSPFFRLSSKDDDGHDIDDEDRSCPKRGDDNRLLPNDEILLINSHRVKNPKLAAHMIKSKYAGNLTLTVSRGNRIEGMSYCLVKLDGSNYHHNRRGATGWGGDAPGGADEERELLHGLQFLPPSTNDGRPLTRVSYVSRDGGGMGPFAKAGLKIGDAILSIDGKVVRSPDDAIRMLRNTIIPNDDPQLQKKEGSSNSSGCNSRVVVILVYSLWELRRKVLHEALNSGGEKWQVSYSHEGQQPLPLSINCEGKEYAILRFTDTTVSFRLDFDVDGICSCYEPFKSLKFLPNERELWQGCDEVEDYSHDSISRHSRHEMRATVELLYKEYIFPTIELLNYHTLRQLRLLADAISASDNVAGTIAKENGGAELKTHEYDLDEQRGDSVATIEPLSDCAELKTHEDDLDEQWGDSVATTQPKSSEAISANAARTIAKKNELVELNTHVDDLDKQRGDSVATPQSNHLVRPGIEQKPRTITNSAIANLTIVNSTNRRWVDRQRNTNYIMYDDSPELNPNRDNNKPLPFRRRGSDPVAWRGTIDTARPNGFPGKNLYERNRQITPIDVGSKEMLKLGLHTSEEISTPQHPDINDIVSATNDVMHSLEMNPKRAVKKSHLFARRGSIDTARPNGFPGKSLHDENRQITPVDESKKDMLTSGVQPTQDISIPQYSDIDDLVSAANNITHDDFPHLNSNEVIRKFEPFARSNGGKNFYDENREITPIDEANKETLRLVVRRNRKISVPQHRDIDDNVSAISMLSFKKATRLNRRRPVLQRRPSMVPSDSWKQSLPHLSNSDSDGESSTSTTSSSGSDGSESSGVGSSNDNEDEETNDTNPQSHPRDEHKHELAERSGRRTRKHRHKSQALSDSISNEIVEHNSEIAQIERNIQPELTPTKQQPLIPPLTKRLKMRIGDVSETYKVLHRIIGTGAFGTVRSCVHRSTREKYAVKSIMKKGHVKNVTLLKNEIAIVQRLNHRHVVKIVDVVQDLQYIHIVMEECLGGDLFDKIVNEGIILTEIRACEIICSLLDAIAYLHERDIVHRDLKPEHIMLSEDNINSHIKIIDFGLATIHGPNDPPMTALAGSAFTLAPEVLKRSYGRGCDLWSVGVIAYFLLTSQVPFNAKSDQEIFAKIMNGTYTFPPWAKTGLTDTAKDFISKLIVVDPKQRMTAKRALSHPWIRGRMVS